MDLKGPFTSLLFQWSNITLSSIADCARPALWSKKLKLEDIFALRAKSSKANSPEITIS